MAENKKILLEIDLNIKDLNQKAANLTKSINEIKKQQKELKDSGQENSVQFQENASKLRELQKEYSNTTKQIDLVTAANNAAEGSYEQLLRQQQIAQTQLKLLEGTLKRNEDGTFALTEEYIRQKEEVEAAKNAIIQFDQGIKDGRTNVGNYTASIKDAIAGTGILGQSLGGAAEKFSGLTGPIKAANLGFGSLRAAIISTGIGAFIVLLGSLVTYFTKTNEGAKKLAQGMAFLEGIVGVLTDKIGQFGGAVFDTIKKAFTDPVQTIKDFGQAIIDNVLNRFRALGLAGKAIVKILQGDLKNGFYDLTNAVAQFGTGIENPIDKLKRLGEEIANVGSQALEAGKKAAELQAQLQRLITIERELSTANAKRRAEAELLIKVADDTTASEERRMEALVKANALLEESAKKELDLKRAMLANLEARNALSDSSEEDLQKEADLRNEIIEAEKTYIVLRQDNNNKINALLDEQRKKREEEAKAEMERIKALDLAELALSLSRQQRRAKEANDRANDPSLSPEERIKALQDANQAEVNAEIDKNAALLENDSLAAAERTMIEEEQKANLLDINKKYYGQIAELEKAKKELEDSDRKRTVKETSSFLGTMAGMFEESSKEYKVLATAQALIDTYAAANAALKTGSGATPVYGYIAAATAVAVGLANVAKINSFRDGVLDLDGPGNGTSDSIPAMLSRGESVMTARETQMFYPELLAMKQASGSMPKFAGGILNYDGGMSSRMASAPVLNNFEQQNTIQNIIESQPPIYVRVSDINSGQDRVATVQERAAV
jgi:hypothetical protein